MVTIKSLEEIISGFLNALSVSGFGPSRAVLFGSYAKGHPHQWSDIDLAVWADKFAGSRIVDTPKMLAQLVPYPDLEVHPFHTGETVNDNPFIEEIETTGKDVSFLLQPDINENHSARFYHAFL